MSWTPFQVLRLRGLFSSLTTHADPTLTSLCSLTSSNSHLRLLHEFKCQHWRQMPHIHHLQRLFTLSSSQLLHPNNNSSSSSSPSTSIKSTKCQTFSSDTLLITETAKKRLQDIFSSESNETSYLRISVEGGGCSGFQYKFEMDSKKIDDTEDIVLTSGENGDKGRVVIDKPSLDILKGSKIDYQTELIRSAFRIIDIPAAGDGCSCGASFTIKID